MGIGEDQYIIRQYSQTSVVIAKTLILVCCDKGLLNSSLIQDWLWKLVFTHSKENSQITNYLQGPLKIIKTISLLTNYQQTLNSINYL